METVLAPLLSATSEDFPLVFLAQHSSPQPPQVILYLYLPKVYKNYWYPLKLTLYAHLKIEKLTQYKCTYGIKLHVNYRLFQ